MSIHTYSEDRKSKFWNVLMALVCIVLLTSCQNQNSKLTGQAATLTAEKKAAMHLVGDHNLQEIAPELWAIDKASAYAAGTFMVFNEAKSLAIFIAQGGAADGGRYVYIGTINTVNNVIVDSNQVMAQLKIDMSQIRTLEQFKAVLKNNGFSELTAAGMPALLQTVRLGLRYMKNTAARVGAAAVNVGSKTITDILLVPALMLTPEMMYPWCQEGDGCQQIDS